MFNLLAILLAVSDTSPIVEQAPEIPQWLWILLILTLVVLPILVVWIGSRLYKRDAQEREKAMAPVAGPDDLKRIEGIGPKIASVLEQAGITTFTQLAETGVDRLEQILAQHQSLRLADPATWPEQAKLAAAGDWVALEALQDVLTGGRHS